MNRNTKIFVIAVHLLLFTLIVFSPAKPKAFGDMDFHPESQAIANGVRSFNFTPLLQLQRAPGPSILYAIPYLFVPRDASDTTFWLSGFILNMIMVIGSMLFFLQSVSRYFGRPVAHAVILLMLLFPIHIYYSYALLAECPALCSMLVILGCTLHILKNNGQKVPKYLVILGIALTAMVLCRPNAVLVYPTFIVLGVLIYLVNKNNFRMYVRPYLVPVLASLIAGFLLLKVATLKVDEISSGRKQGEHLLYVVHEGHFQYRHEPFDWRFWEEEIRGDSHDYQDWVRSKDSLHTLSSSTGRSMEELYKDYLIKDKSSHPFIVARQFVLRLLSGQLFQVSSQQPHDLTTAPFKKNIKYFLIVFLINIVNIIIWIFAIKTLLRNRKIFLILLPAFSVLIALYVFHGFVYMETRYLLPTRFLLILLAGISLAPVLAKRAPKYFSSLKTQDQ